jgi:hypothetical protein
MMRIALAIVFILTAAIAQAQSNAIPRIAKDTDYAAARKALLAQGYAPERLADAMTCEKDDLRCFPETFSCAGTGLGACLHVWRRGSAVIEVNTIGEQPVVDRVRCRSGC